MGEKELMLIVERVDNGWVIRAWSAGSYGRGGEIPSRTMVARTPDQLSQLLHEWATKQQDAPKVLHSC